MLAKKSSIAAIVTIAAALLSALAGSAVADQPTTAATATTPTKDAKPSTDKWVAPPAVSPAIEIPSNVPERDPAAPAVSSISDGSSGPDGGAAPATDASDTVRTYETLSRATDRRYSITTFNNVQRGFRTVYSLCRRVLTGTPAPSAP